MPKVELQRKAITIVADSKENTVDVIYTDTDRLNNLVICVRGLGALYQWCIEAGIPEEEIQEKMVGNLLGVIDGLKKF